MNATISAITCAKVYGVGKSELNKHLLHNPVIPTNLQHCLDTYYLLYWSPDYFLEKERDGFIIHHAQRYIVMMAPNVSRNKIVHANQIKLSFRKAKPEFELPAIVYVTLPNL